MADLSRLLKLTGKRFVAISSFWREQLATPCRAEIGQRLLTGSHRRSRCAHNDITADAELRVLVQVTLIYLATGPHIHGHSI